MTTANSNPTATPASAVRCSSAEREQVSARLHEAAGEGRLSMDDVEERLALVYSARYQHDLDAITADLPATTTSAGWRAIATAARRQLADDLHTYLTRTTDPAHRLRTIAITVGVLVVIAAMVFFALHGIVDEGPDLHDLD